MRSTARSMSSRFSSTVSLSISSADCKTHWNFIDHCWKSFPTHSLTSNKCYQIKTNLPLVLVSSARSVILQHPLLQEDPLRPNPCQDLEQVCCLLVILELSLYLGGKHLLRISAHCSFKRRKRYFNQGILAPLTLLSQNFCWPRALGSIPACTSITTNEQSITPRYSSLPINSQSIILRAVTTGPKWLPRGLFLDFLVKFVSQEV